MRTPPKKPFKTFPMFAHANGQWAKKIRGKLHYFGPSSEPQAALDRFKVEFPALAAGGKRPARHETVAAVVSAYLSSKQASLESGDLTPATLADYKRICKVIELALGRETAIASVDRPDLEQLRTYLVKGKRGPLGPVSQKRRIGMARLVFNFANEELDCNIKYRKVLRMPSAKSLRAARNRTGERLFTPGEIQALIDNAKPQMKAMVLLGINCGFGNGDCATLPIERVDLSGWHNHARPKTEIARRCPLWPSTAAALYAVVKDRTSGPVFITKYGNPWEGTGNSCPISYEFRKLATGLGIWRTGVTTFYTLRRTFETIGATTGDQIAVSYIMGHTPASDDMSAVYRQRTFDSQLVRVVDHIHDWLHGRITLV